MINCVGCGGPVGDDETRVYADEGVYHMGCEFSDIYAEVGSGEFDR